MQEELTCFALQLGEPLVDRSGVSALSLYIPGQLPPSGVWSGGRRRRAACPGPLACHYNYEGKTHCLSLNHVDYDLMGHHRSHDESSRQGVQIRVPKDLANLGYF